MRTAGRPVSPTVHPRTKPEAEEFAQQSRKTNDWFRHDGKNAEPPPPGKQKCIYLYPCGTSIFYFGQTHFSTIDRKANHRIK